MACHTSALYLFDHKIETGAGSPACLYLGKSLDCEHTNDITGNNSGT